MNLDDIKIDDSKITEKELDAIYIYLSMSFESMTKEEKQMWINIMQKIDKQFYEN